MSKFLYDEINKNIAQSKIDGGIKLADLKVGALVVVQTNNTLYEIMKTGQESYTIKGNAKYCPVETDCNIAGSTWGGSLLKVGFISKGMQLEFSTKTHPIPITTSTIKEVKEINDTL